MADFEEISILYVGIKNMVKSQTVRSINTLVARMSSYALFCGNSRKYKIKKTKMDIIRPPLTDILSEIRICAGGKKLYQHTVTLAW